MLIIVISRSGLKLDHDRLKTRSLDQILEKLCVHSRVHSFVSNVMTLLQYVNHHHIYVRFETGSCWVKNNVTRSTGYSGEQFRATMAFVFGFGFFVKIVHLL